MPVSSRGEAHESATDPSLDRLARRPCHPVMDADPEGSFNIVQRDTHRSHVACPA